MQREAVLDRIDALADRKPCARQPLDVGRDTHAHAMGLVDDRSSSSSVICAGSGSSATTDRAPVLTPYVGPPASRCSSIAGRADSTPASSPGATDTVSCSNAIRR